MGKTILAVDDDIEILRVIQANLLRAGYQVRTASDGVDALRSIGESHPDLVILDVTMPLLSGYDVVRELRADPATRTIPVIMLTARASNLDTVGGLHVGADIYLTKPFHPTELLQFVERMLTPESESSG